MSLTSGTRQPSQSLDPIQTIQGGCLCGAMRYEATGRPYNITHCHCTDCRRSSGAAFVTWASLLRTQFLFTRGEAKSPGCAEG